MLRVREKGGTTTAGAAAPVVIASDSMWEPCHVGFCVTDDRTLRGIASPWCDDEMLYYRKITRHKSGTTTTATPAPGVMLAGIIRHMVSSHPLSHLLYPGGRQGAKVTLTHFTTKTENVRTLIPSSLSSKRGCSSKGAHYVSPPLPCRNCNRGCRARLIAILELLKH